MENSYENQSNVKKYLLIGLLVTAVVILITFIVLNIKKKNFLQYLLDNEFEVRENDTITRITFEESDKLFDVFMNIIIDKLDSEGVVQSSTVADRLPFNYSFFSKKLSNKDIPMIEKVTDVEIMDKNLSMLTYKDDVLESNLVFNLVE